MITATFHSKQARDFQAKGKASTICGVAYPVVTIESEVGDITFFSSIDQLKQIRTAIDEAIKATHALNSIEEKVEHIEKSSGY
jgi:hypothetical protein